MKKMLFCAAVAGTVLSSCQSQQSECYTLRSEDGHTTMVIDATHGARILSLKYDEVEVLSQIDEPNMFGSTFWTSPQKVWNWPPVQEHDSGAYQVEEREDQLIMTSAVPALLPLRVAKAFASTESGFRITYSITNCGKEDCQVAPWEITRVPGKGVVAFYGLADNVWPAGLMNFCQQDERAVFMIDATQQQRKINANGRPNPAAEGMLTGMSMLEYRNPDTHLVFTKYFPDLQDGQAAPGEDEIQVYLHNDSRYCELEAQGEYTCLRPGESLEWTVFWQVEWE